MDTSVRKVSLGLLGRPGSGGFTFRHLGRRRLAAVEVDLRLRVPLGDLRRPRRRPRLGHTRDDREPRMG